MGTVENLNAREYNSLRAFILAINDEIISN
jgi:hypothetical protein